jgi:hypothetical protein
LDAWEYIKYLPSHNPYKGSQIYLYNFNKTSDNGIDISSDTNSNKTIGKTPEKAVIPSLNSINNTNKINNANDNESEHKITTTTKSNFNDNKKKKKSCAKKEKIYQQEGLHHNEERGGHPNSKVVTDYFTKKQWPAIEGEKFFNHYESNGWLVGGKTPMKNWKASANNWMLNAESFKKNGPIKKPSAGKLHTSTAKDYTEPL